MKKLSSRECRSWSPGSGTGSGASATARSGSTRTPGGRAARGFSDCRSAAWVLGIAVVLLACLFAVPAAAQTDAAQVKTLVEPRLIPPDVVSYQALQYLMGRVPPFDVPTTREAWELEARKIRGHLTELILTAGHTSTSEPIPASRRRA